MLNVRLAGDYLFGKLLFTWLSLVMSLMASFCAVFFPTRRLDDIWDLIGSVSEGFFFILFYPYTIGMLAADVCSYVVNKNNYSVIM